MDTETTPHLFHQGYTCQEEMARLRPKLFPLPSKYDYQDWLSIEFEFAEDEKRLDNLVEKFVDFTSRFHQGGILIYSRAPIGSGFQAELRATTLKPFAQLLDEHRVKPAAKLLLLGLCEIAPFRVISWANSSMVGKVQPGEFNLHKFTDYVVEEFPLLGGYYSDCLAEPVDVRQIILKDLKASGMFFVKWA